MERLNHKPKITPNDNAVQAMVKMAEGNPGAVNVLLAIMQHDWPEGMPGIFKIMQLDSMGIYGSDLHVLWKYCCGQDIDKVGKVISKWHQGELSLAEIFEHLHPSQMKPINL